MKWEKKGQEETILKIICNDYTKKIPGISR